MRFTRSAYEVLLSTSMDGLKDGKTWWHLSFVGSKFGKHKSQQGSERSRVASPKRIDRQKKISSRESSNFHLGRLKTESKRVLELPQVKLFKSCCAGQTVRPAWNNHRCNNHDCIWPIGHWFGDVSTSKWCYFDKLEVLQEWRVSHCAKNRFLLVLIILSFSSGMTERWSAALNKGHGRLTFWWLLVGAETKMWD